jgi:hypothetical protein
MTVVRKFQMPDKGWTIWGRSYFDGGFPANASNCKNPKNHNNAIACDTPKSK